MYTYNKLLHIAFIIIHLLARSIRAKRTVEEIHDEQEIGIN